jgi:hypothetical protein
MPDAGFFIFSLASSRTRMLFIYLVDTMRRP